MTVTWIVCSVAYPSDAVRLTQLLRASGHRFMSGAIRLPGEPGNCNCRLGNDWSVRLSRSNAAKGPFNEDQRCQLPL